MFILIYSKDGRGYIEEYSTHDEVKERYYNVVDFATIAAVFYKVTNNRYNEIYLDLDMGE